MKTLLFIGHPGHELLAYKFMCIHKPEVIFLTGGSSSDNISRIHQSIKLVKSLGLKVHFPIEPFMDRDIYDLILSKSTDDFLKIKSALKKFVIENSIKRIVGDALEGFNPSHDICRYLINSIVTEVKNEIDVTIDNYEFFQENVSQNKTLLKSDEDIQIKLNKKEFDNKLKVCLDYSEIKFELDKFINLYGEDFFMIEYFRKIKNTEQIKTWDSKYPYYEEFGRKRIKEGTYSELISFENHMKIIALALQNEITI